MRDGSMGLKLTRISAKVNDKISLTGPAGVWLLRHDLMSYQKGPGQTLL